MSRLDSLSRETEMGITKIWEKGLTVGGTEKGLFFPWKKEEGRGKKRWSIKYNKYVGE